MDQSKEVHLLTLKVMRLSRPTFATNPNLFIDELSTLKYGKDAFISAQRQQLTGRDSNYSNVNLRRQENLAADFSISDLLVLPTSFGSIYLGETFSAYLCVNNDSPVTVKNVSIKVELQTSLERIGLFDTTSHPNSNLIMHQTIEFVVGHEIKELGVHILVCTINYTTPKDEKKFFRKFYKFQVSNPLAVKTKVNSISNSSLVFLEAQVQNMTTSPILIDRVKLEPFEAFKCEDLNFESGGSASAENADAKSVFAETNYINPQDIRQYLYRLYPRDTDSNVHSVPTLGKLDILWRSPMGELGRLQTSQLIRKLPSKEFLEITIDQLPELIVVEEKFRVSIKVKNLSKSRVKLVLDAVKERMTSVLVTGTAHIELGSLEPDESLLVALDFFALIPGIGRIEGIRIVDSISAAVHESSTFDVFVHRAGR